MFLFALVLNWFRPEYVSLEQGLGPHLAFLVYPALAIALPKSAMTVKLLRGSILGELDQDYVRTAYSKGNSQGSALRRHVLRNAMIPVVTFLAMAIGLATGMGFLTLAAIFTVIVAIVNVAYVLSPFGKPRQPQKSLKITIPRIWTSTACSTRRWRAIPPPPSSWRCAPPTWEASSSLSTWCA